LKLNAPTTSIVTVNYAATSASTAVPSCCQTINNTASATPAPISVVNWNRDYGLTLNSGNFAVFYPGATTVTVPITIYPNGRYTANYPTVVLAINSIQVGSSPIQAETSPPTFSLQIQNSNPQPAVGTITFSNLMSSGGAFALNCVGCHNPVNVTAGLVPYDMTTYTSLLQNNRVVPNDPNASLVWIRINDAPVPDIVNGQQVTINGVPQFISNGVSAMPLNGVFNSEDPTGKNDIFNWISNGALDN